MTQPLSLRWKSQRANTGLALLGSLLFLIGVGATAGQTIVKYQSPGPFDPTRQGMCDFHNGVYFPTQALLLAGPLAGVVIGRIDEWRRRSSVLRWSLAGLMLWPAYNRKSGIGDVSKK